MSSNLKNEYVVEYDILRVCTIFLVVFGHSDFLYSHKFSVCNSIPETLQAYVIDYSSIRPWIYSFHMPLFMLLSGALFSITYNNYSPAEYFKNRFFRLMVPYITCGILFAIPIKWIVGYFGNYSLMWAYVQSLVFIISPGHLWFLWVLFVINLFFYYLASKSKLNWRVLFCLVLLNFVSLCGIGWFQIFRLLEYPLYFYLGYIFEVGGLRKKVISCFRQTSQNKQIIMTLMTFIFTILMIVFTRFIVMPNLILHLIGIVQALIGSAFMFLISMNFAISADFLQGHLYKISKKWNFSIYLYHEPLQFLLLWILAKTDVLRYFNNNGMYIVLCILRFLLTISTSIFIGRTVSAVKKITIFNL